MVTERVAEFCVEVERFIALCLVVERLECCGVQTLWRDVVLGDVGVKVMDGVL